MNVHYSSDARRGPGYGILTCSDPEGGSAFPPGAYSLALLRASARDYLAPAPGAAVWVGETRFFPVTAEHEQHGVLRVLVGPEVVNALDPQEQYQVTLRPEAADGDTGGTTPAFTGRLRLSGVTVVPGGSLDNTPDAPKSAPLVQSVQPVPPVPPVPPVEEASAEPAQPEPAGPAGPADEDTAPLAMTPRADPPRARRLVPLLLLALALVAGGIAAWQFFGGKAAEERAALNPAAQPATPAAPATQAGAAPQGQQEQTPLSAEEQVRRFFSGPDITAKAALALAAGLPLKTTAEQDAAYRLYYFAAEQEAPAAFMPYAACLDPACPQWGSIEKDAPAAYAAYAKAAAADPKTAKAALEAQTRLRAWLDSQARAGNARASAWLRELP